ncbi:O-antigen ligase family protein [Lacrimispora saccharolytica]|nr:O-antigen ligase family protein [Lacrimispora saccharolytica]
MKRNLKIGSLSVVKMFVLLYPICPRYFYVASIPIKELILFFSFTVILFWTKGSILKKKKTRPHFYEIIIWTIVWFAIQLYHAEWMQAATQIILWIGMVFLCSRVINTKEKFISIIDTVILGGVIVGIFGLVEEVTHYNVFTLLNTINAEINYNPMRLGILRIISFTSHAISYGCYCLMVLALVFYRISLSKEKKFYFGAVLIFANAFLTLSRIALVGIAVEVVAFLWFSGHKRFFKKVLQFLVIGGIILLIACLISNNIRRYVMLFSYVILAVFDESYVDTLVSVGFTDNAGGIGNRLDLYKWVYEETKGHLLLGNGASTLFEYRFLNEDGYWQTKSSIEVEWLRTLYRYGIIGMLAEIYFYVRLIKNSLSKIFRKPTEWEGVISFPRVMAALLIGYVVVLFGVMQNQEVQVLSVVIMLLLAYSYNGGFRKVIRS